MLSITKRTREHFLFCSVSIIPNNMPKPNNDLFDSTHFTLPRMTPVIKILLLSFGVFFVLQMLDLYWLPTQGILERWCVLNPKQVLHGQIWRLLSYPWVQSPEVSTLFWGAITLYFFGTTLETLLGSHRFCIFLILNIFVAGLFATLAGLFHSTFFTQPTYGLAPLSFALTAAWGAKFPNQKLLFPPIRGKTLVWFCTALALIPVLIRSPRESPAASLGAIALGWSLARVWHRIDIFLDTLFTKKRKTQKQSETYNKVLEFKPRASKNKLN